VRLLDLVEQHNRVRAPAHGLGELAALLVADVARRGADEAGHRVLLLVLGHVDADHRPLVVEQEVGQRPGQLGLAHPGGSEEEETADGAVGVGQARPAAADGVGHRGHGVLLAHHPLVEVVLQVDELGHLGLHEPRHGDAGPAADHLGHVLLVHLLLEHLLLGLELGQAGGGRLDLLLQLRHAPVADLGRLLEVGLPLHLLAQGLELLLELADRADGLLLGLPVGDHRRLLLVELGQLLLEGLEPLLAGGVGLLGQRHPLDLQLPDAALDDVDLGGHRVDLDAELAGRLVHQVDGLVGQEATGEVAVGEHGGGHQGGVLDANTVVDLVALLQAPEDGDGVLDRGLADEDLLEAALEGGVLLDVLAVLVEGGGADHAELAAGQQGLDHVARVHGPLGRARPHDRVELVDEGDHLALRLGDLLEDGLQPLLELAPVLGPGDHAAEVEGDQPAVAQALGHVALDDAAGQALDDGGLAHAGLADEHGVVLGPPGEDLDDPADLVVAADDRVELALAGVLGEVAAVALQRLVLLLRVLAGHPVAAADLLEGAQQLVPGHLQPVGQGQQQVLGGEVLVTEGLALVVTPLQHLAQVAAELGVGAVGLGQGGQRLLHPVAQLERGPPHLLEDGQDHALGLAQQGGEQVVGGDLGVVGGLRRGHRVVDRVLGLERPPVGVEDHGSASPAEHDHRLLDRDQVPPALAGLLPQLVELGLQLGHLPFELEDAAHALEVVALGGEVLDAAQQGDVVVAVAPAAALGAGGLDQSPALVDAQGLGVDPGQLGGHRDHVDGVGALWCHGFLPRCPGWTVGTRPTPRPAPPPPRARPWRGWPGPPPRW
jgi:hypothetical protein